MIPIDLMAECNRRFADQISSVSQSWKHFIEHNIGQTEKIEPLNSMNTYAKYVQTAARAFHNEADEITRFNETPDADRKD